jgi:hypothetical protein
MCKFSTIGEIQMQQLEIRRIDRDLAEKKNGKRTENEIAFSKSKLGR